MNNKLGAGEAESVQGGDAVAFLVGAGRSGTTMLYKLLALHKSIAVITTYDRFFPHWVPTSLVLRGLRRFPRLKIGMWFDSEGNAYTFGRVPHKRILPKPTEGEFLYESCGLPLTPAEHYELPADVAACLRDRFESMRRRAGADILLTKRTANNRRLMHLQRAFPRARYINIVRDGRDVAYSLSRVSWWPKHVIWWANCTPGELEAQGMAPLAICARNWAEEIRCINSGRQGIPRERWLDVRYEELLADPLRVISNILAFIGLSTYPDFESALRSLDIREKRRDLSKIWTPDEQAVVLGEIEPTLKEMGYTG